MLTKRKSGDASRSKLQAVAAGLASGVIDRRTFLRQSGLTVGGLAAIGSIQLGSVRKAQAAGSMVDKPEIRKNICTHCSVGCTVTAEVVNGVWVGQEPSWDSPINRGTHCAKGAATMPASRLSWDVPGCERGRRKRTVVQPGWKTGSFHSPSGYQP
jgi:formate dehydrogenase major subunit